MKIEDLEKHEDAFKAANLFAGGKIDLNVALSKANDSEDAKKTLVYCQKIYAALFEAFIAGVDYGRENPRDKE